MCSQVAISMQCVTVIFLDLVVLVHTPGEAFPAVFETCDDGKFDLKLTCWLGELR